MAFKYTDDGYPESSEYDTNYEWITSVVEPGRTVGATRGQRALHTDCCRLLSLVCRVRRGMLRYLRLAA